MSGYNLPTVTNTYNVYKKGNAMIGLSDEITIPDFEAITEEMSGSGLLGKIQEAVMGHFGSQNMEIPFLNLDDDIFSFADPLEVIDLNLRAAQQQLKKDKGTAGYRGLRIAVRGKMISFKPGVLKQGGRMNASVKLELHYILIEIDGETKLELDKLNSVYRVNGKDIMEEMRQYC
jgi:hypothetical protein